MTSEYGSEGLTQLVVPWLGVHRDVSYGSH